MRDNTLYYSGFFICSNNSYMQMTSSSNRSSSWTWGQCVASEPKKNVIYYRTT